MSKTVNVVSNCQKPSGLPGGCASFYIRISFQKSEQNNSGVYKITEEKRDALAYVTLSHSLSVGKKAKQQHAIHQKCIQHFIMQTNCSGTKPVK